MNSVWFNQEQVPLDKPHFPTHGDGEVELHAWTLTASGWMSSRELQEQNWGTELPGTESSQIRNQCGENECSLEPQGFLVHVLFWPTFLLAALMWTLKKAITSADNRAGGGYNRMRTLSQPIDWRQMEG